MGNPLAPLKLADHYSRFRVAERLLLTGHSHQAWPDVAFEAQQRAWLDAAELVDDKWERAAEVADEVRAGWRRLLKDSDGDIALGQNTHELVVRLLSALPGMWGRASARPKSITTGGEFHTIRRQLDRLAEEGLEVVKIAAQPVDTLAARLASVVDDRTACVMVSSVLFETAEIVPNLHHLADVSERHGAALLVDAYHHLNVVPFDIHAMGLARAFVVGGGYKYCQLGEGNCFLRLPRGTDLRPIITGWFSEFGELDRKQSRVSGIEHGEQSPVRVRYGDGAARFAGATYDPTSHYRAAAVFAFHQQMGLTPENLRAISQHQVSQLIIRIESLDLDPAVASIVDVRRERRGGFVAIRAPRATSLVADLRRRGVVADARGDILRLGPAPYLSDEQLTEAIEILGEVVKGSCRLG
jgi:kynureninase